MYFAKLRSSFYALVRYWLVVAIVLFFGFAIIAKPVAWAASVPESGNQTVPPGLEKLYLPLIKLFD